jgi:hypothetical protein
MNLPKMPSAFMQGLIALLLIGNFTFMLIAPSVITSYKPPGDALTQTLVNLVILAVGYYLGSSSGSARKDEINAAQQDKAITALAPTTLVSGPDAAPVAVKIDDSKPIAVDQVGPKVG